MNETRSRHVLVVDDQTDFARGLGRLIQGEFDEVNVHVAESGEQALKRLENTPVNVMITDLQMPGMDGLTLLREALVRCPSLSAVMLTAHGTIETAVDALKAGAYDFLTKPTEPEDVFRVVANGLERSQLLDENRQLRDQLERHKDKLIGESPVMQRLKQSIQAVAQTDYNVLILGESGTGKELAAAMVRELSPRADRPFITLNCTAIPENLLESELFGHVKGAFSGAEQNRDGLFVKAHTGTILLDEIGDIPMETQAKLLRVLQEGEIRPVGSDVSRKVDVRIIASTNQDLAARIAGQDLPRGPLPPAQRAHPDPAPAQGAPGRHSASGPLLPAQGVRRARPARQGHLPRHTGRTRGQALARQHPRIAKRHAQARCLRRRAAPAGPVHRRSPVSFPGPGKANCRRSRRPRGWCWTPSPWTTSARP